jgi:hypothetical protein
MPPFTSLVALTHLPMLAAWDTWIRLHPLDAANCALFTPVLMFYCHNSLPDTFVTYFEIST